MDIRSSSNSCLAKSAILPRKNDRFTRKQRNKMHNLILNHRQVMVAIEQWLEELVGLRCNSSYSGFRIIQQQPYIALLSAFQPFFTIKKTKKINKIFCLENLRLKMTNSSTSTLLSNQAVQAVTMAVISVTVFVTIGRVSTSGGKKLKKAKLPPGAWLSQGSFSALEALVDTFFPSVSIVDSNREDIKQLALSLGVLPDGKEGLNDVEIKRVEKFLAMGAHEYGTAKHVMHALKTCCSKTDQTTLGIALFVLSTTFGSFLLTGYPVPFYVSKHHLCPSCYIILINYLGLAIAYS